MLDVDDYVNNSKDPGDEAYSYDSYIGVELNFPDTNGYAVDRHVKKKNWNYDGQAVCVVNRNPLLDTSKYEVEYLDGYIE